MVRLLERVTRAATESGRGVVLPAAIAVSRVDRFSTPPLPPATPARSIGTRLEDASGELQSRGGRWERRQLGNGGVAAYRLLLSQRVMNTYGADGSYGFPERLRVVNSIAGALDTSGVAVFVGELNALLANPKARAFLDDLEGALGRGTQAEPTQLWNLALQHAGSHDEAVRWLAVLLQDYSPFALQGRGVLEALRDPAAARLQRVLHAVARAESAGSLSAYPPGENLTQARFYHYYVPALLARRLVDRGVSPGLAFLTAATFNLEYELAKPSVLAARQARAAERLFALLQQHASVGPERLAATVAELRRTHRVDATFEIGDLSLVDDLRLPVEAVRALCTAVAAEYQLPAAAREALLRAVGSAELTVNLIAETVNAAYMQTVTQHAADLSLPGLMSDAGEVAGPGLAFANAGRHAAVHLGESESQSTYAGFMGAANVLPGRAFAVSREQLIGQLSANPTRTMQALFAAPPAALATTSSVRVSDPPSVDDALHERLRDYAGSRDARATVAIIDSEFNRGVAGGRDFIDRDDDPTSRAFLTLHGTPLVELATRGTPGLSALPLRADFATTPAAIQHAADSGATCVVISQQMTAVDAQSLQLFRDVLRRNPNLLVVVASGNHGAIAGARGYEISTLDEPNLVVVAAADANGMVSALSNYHPRLVRFAVRGGSRDDRLWQDPASRTSNWVMRQTRPNVEYTSQAAPAFANLYAKVRLVAPSLTAAQALRAISLTAATDAVTAQRVRDGVPSAERAQQLAALFEMTGKGASFEQGARLLGLRAGLLPQARRDLAALRAGAVADH